MSSYEDDIKESDLHYIKHAGRGRAPCGRALGAGFDDHLFESMVLYSDFFHGRSRPGGFFLMGSQELTI